MTGGGADSGEQDAALKTGVFYLYWVWAAIVIGIGLTAIGNCASDAEHGQPVVSNKM